MNNQPEIIDDNHPHLIRKLAEFGGLLSPVAHRIIADHQERTLCHDCGEKLYICRCNPGSG
jgi:hypothetical protein